jgi:trehalose/maltose hydrolase-like predicted phosphorylase
MQPGIAASHPEAAQIITNYRVAKYSQARENIHTAFTSSKNNTHFSDSAAIYSWTSGRFGNCTGVGPCFDYEYHLNGDIGLSFINQWVATGDTTFFKETLFPIYDSIATMFSNLLEQNGTSWTLTNMTDPVSSVMKYVSINISQLTTRRRMSMQTTLMQVGTRCP